MTIEDAWNCGQLERVFLSREGSSESAVTESYHVGMWAQCCQIFLYLLRQVIKPKFEMKFSNFLKCHEDQTHNSVSIYGPQAVILCDSV